MMKKTKNANIDQQRGLFLQVGFLGALFLVWIGMEWTNPQYQPRNKNIVGVEMDVMKIVAKPNQTNAKQRTNTAEAKQHETIPLQFAARMPKANMREVLNQCVAKHKHYPQEAKSKGIEGKVLVNFQLDSTGRMVRPRIVRSIHPLLDNEALRIIKQQDSNLPWNEQQAYIEWYCIPVTFTH